MKKLIAKIREILRNRRVRKLWTRIVSSIACLVVFVTTYALVLPAITMESQASCGIEAHQHDDSCYEERLTCNIPEADGHTHTEDCYSTKQKLICDRSEHVHNSDCYDENGNLICSLEEHQHGRECFEETRELVCGLEEAEGHHHDSSCYEKVLACGKEAHTHSQACYREDAASAMATERAAVAATTAASEGGNTAAADTAASEGGKTATAYTAASEEENISADATTASADGNAAAATASTTRDTAAGADGAGESSGASGTFDPAQTASEGYVPALEELDFQQLLNSGTAIYYHRPADDTEADSSEQITDWQKADKDTVLGENDLLRVYLAYTIPAGSLNETNAVARYRLPANLHLTDDQIQAISQTENGLSGLYVDSDTLQITDTEKHASYLGYEAIDGTRTPDQKIDDYFSDNNSAANGDQAAQEIISAAVRAENVYDHDGIYGEKNAYLGTDLVFTFSPYTILKNRNEYDSDGTPVKAGESVSGWFALDINMDQVDWDHNTAEIIFVSENKELNTGLVSATLQKAEPVTEETHPAVSFKDSLTVHTGSLGSDTASGTLPESSKLTVSVSAEAGTFPAGTTMVLSAVTDMDAVAEAVEGTVDSKTRGFQAVDISFRDKDGNEIEPLKPISVTMRSDSIKAATEDSSMAPVVVHVEDRKKETAEASDSPAATVIETLPKTFPDTTENKEQSETPAATNSPDAISFEADAFSVYAIVYTVDFHYEVNGKVYDFSIPGGGFVSLEHLVEMLGMATDGVNSENENDNAENADVSVEEVPDVEEDDEKCTAYEEAINLNQVEVSEATKKFVADVESVEFSNPGLVWVGKVDSAATVGGLKEANGLEVEYSAELTEEQITEINAQTITAGDWALISQVPFESEEMLTITMKDGKTWSVAVTDVQVGIGSTGTTNVYTYAGLQAGSLENGQKYIIYGYDYTSKKYYALVPSTDLHTVEITLKGNVVQYSGSENLYWDVNTESFGSGYNSGTSYIFSFQKDGETYYLSEGTTGQSLEVLTTRENYDSSKTTDWMVYPGWFGYSYLHCSYDTFMRCENGIFKTVHKGFFDEWDQSHIYFERYGIQTSTSDKKVNIHYGYMEGNVFKEFPSDPIPSPIDDFGGATEAYLTYDFDGWHALNQVYYHTSEKTDPTSAGTRIQNTLYRDNDNDWLYSTDLSGYYMPAKGGGYYTRWDYTDDLRQYYLGDNEVNNNSHIYVLYEKDKSPTNGGSPKPTNIDGEKPADPSITKTSDINHDGTNTIHLAIEGHTKDLKTNEMADVILIFDTSGSMGYVMDEERDPYWNERNPEIRMDATKNAAYSLIDNLLGQNLEGATEETAKYRVGLVTFSDTVDNSKLINCTKDKTILKNTINGLEADGGTNWEEALQKANEMAVASDRSTFIIFITDGNPTFRKTRGNYTDSQLGTISTNDRFGNPRTDLSRWHAQYNVFGPGNGDWLDGVNAIYENGRVDQTGDESGGRNYNAAKEQALSIVQHGKNLFTLGIGPAVGRLTTLANDVGVTGNNYYATDVQALNQAMQKIIAQIKGQLGYSNVSITDGITPLTELVQKEDRSDELPAEDDFVYEKYRAATQEEITNPPVGTTIEIRDNVECIVWKNWDPTSEGANRANYNSQNGAVEWNLGKTFFLEEGVTYRCSFKVWPSQEAYDIIAKLNNGTLDYNHDLTSAQKAQITGNNTAGYTLLTNMPNDSEAQKAIGSEVGAHYSYEEATKVGNIVSIVNNTEANGSFTPVDSLNLEKQQITIKKEWENNLDSRKQTDSITLNVVAADAPVSQPPFATVAVGGEANPSWTNSVYISTGLLKVVGGQTIVYEQGHDFKLTEGADLTYYWELEADTYRPMVITDADKGYNEPTAVLLSKVASNATEGEYDYEIDGGKYKIVQTGSDALKAFNKRRSNLNLTKKVVKKDGTTDITDSVDDLFEFSITINDKNKHDVWYSVNEVANDESTKVKDLVTSGTPEIKDGSHTGYFYVSSGNSFTVSLKPGWNLRITNLPSGSTYKIVETGKEGYELQDVTIDNDGSVTVDKDSATASGTITAPNASFTITALNKLTTNSILIKKTNLEGNESLEGATFKLYKKNKNGIYELFRDTFSVETSGYMCHGLAVGDYKLEEQTPPPGYIITVKEVNFAVSESGTNVITLAAGQENAVVSGTNKDVISIKNEPGAALPSAGGPGTRLFTILGSILVFGAGALLWRRRRFI